MALRVVGHVDHRAADRRGQLLAAHEARRVEIGRRQHANALGGVGEGDFDFGEQLGQACSLFPSPALLSFERGSCSAESCSPSA